MQEKTGHRHPCRDGSTELAMGALAWSVLERCDTCGALWDRGERTLHRVLASDAATLYPDAVVDPFVLSRPAQAGPPSGYWAHLNQGAVYRFYVEVERAGEPEIWAIVSGGVLERIPALDRGPLEERTADRFDELVASLGEVPSAALRLALTGGLHPVSLKPSTSRGCLALRRPRDHAHHPTNLLMKYSSRSSTPARYRPRTSLSKVSPRSRADSRARPHPHPLLLMELV